MSFRPVYNSILQQHHSSLFHLVSVLSAALYFGSWFFCKANDLVGINPEINRLSSPQLQAPCLTPPQTPVPGLEIRQQRQADGQQSNPEEDAHAQDSLDSRCSSPVLGSARVTIGNDSVSLSFNNEGEGRNAASCSFLPATQFESSI